MSTLYDISWQVDEPCYRADPALSYSTLAKYEREGFEKLDTLFDKVETPSLLLGSCVDTWITDGLNEFNNKYLVADIPSIPDSIATIVKSLFDNYSADYHNIYDIPNEYVITYVNMNNYQQNWKPETRAKVIKEKGESYYNYLYLADGKIVITTELYQTVCNMVSVLKESEATKWYFQTDNPFDDVIRHYQLKFKHTYDSIDYRCMADLIIEIPSEKLIIPCDLKTSGHAEYDFFSSFKQWRYDVQSRLYWRLIRANMDKSDKYKEWTLANYRFIVVNKKTLNPLVWEFKETQETGTLYFGKTKQIEFRDPYAIGEELRYYLDNMPKVPKGISNTDINDLSEWLNDL